MTREELISGLYAHFSQMHGEWIKCTEKWGEGALVFQPPDYENAGDFTQVQWDFWRRDQVLDYLKEETSAELALTLEQKEFLWRAGDDEFLSVVIQYNAEKSRHEVEIHRIDRALLN